MSCLGSKRSAEISYWFCRRLRISAPRLAIERLRSSFMVYIHRPQSYGMQTPLGPMHTPRSYVEPVGLFTAEDRGFEHDRPQTPKPKQKGTPAQIILHPCSNFSESTIQCSPCFQPIPTLAYDNFRIRVIHGGLNRSLTHPVHDFELSADRPWTALIKAPLSLSCPPKDKTKSRSAFYQPNRNPKPLLKESSSL